MARWGQTTFTEFVGSYSSPDEQFTQDSGRIVRKLDITPGTMIARQQAVADFLGYQKVVTVNSQSGAFTLTYITRGTPLPYTWASTNPALLPTSQYLYAANIVRGEPVGPPISATPVLAGNQPNGGLGVAVGGDFPRYRFTVEFTTRPYDILPDSSILAVNSGGNVNQLAPSPLFDDSVPPGIGYPDEGQYWGGIQFVQPFFSWAGLNVKPKFSTGSRYISRLFRPGARLRVLPFGMLSWASDGVPIREGFPYSESTGSYRVIWHLVPEAGIPLKAIENQINTVNSFWFDGFPQFTLLFKSADFRRMRGPLGDILYDIEYLFSWLPNVSLEPAANKESLGWNYQLRFKNNVLQYDKVVDSPNNVSPRSPYPFTNFTNLFRPDQ